VNISLSVNITRARGASLERALSGVLERLLHEATWLQKWRVAPDGNAWDLSASGPLPAGGKGVLCVECKGANFQPSQFPRLAERACSAGRNAVCARVLAMPRVSPRMAALCQQHGWSWYDLAGNCRLEIPGVLLIERSGREPVKLEPRSGANLGTPAAARVVRALLAAENAGKRWTQREMAGHFANLLPAVPGPSLALVNKVVQHLRDQALIESLPNRGFRVSDFDGLLQAWREAYRFDRHVRRPYFTLLQGRAFQEKLRSLDSEGGGRLAYAAFSAADVQAPTVRQPRTWLYISGDFERAFASALDAKLVDSGENLVVLIPDDGGVFYRMDVGANRAPCTNPVQTYVDLVKAGGRGEEAAEAILEQRLKPAWAGAP
jgi:DNA-binding GntR family transcriptional regulator